MINQIDRSAKPTGADVPDITHHDQPENKQLMEVTNKPPETSEQLNKLNERKLTGLQDGAIPGSRSGNPLENPAEHLLGDKVHNICGSTMKLEVQSHDKSISQSSPLNTENNIKKRKISLLFPGINPDVSKKQLKIFIIKTETPDSKIELKESARKTMGESTKNQWDSPAICFLPPDVPNLEILVPLDSVVRVELTHIDQYSRESHPYVLTFSSNPAINPKPFEASPIGFEIMEEVLTNE